MRLREDSPERKLRGAYHTPPRLADAMARLCASEDVHAVLEPSCGGGVFLDSLARMGLIGRVGTVDAVEIEPEEAEKVRRNHRGRRNVHVFNEDFFGFYSRAAGAGMRYDLILGNPPYIRYQYLTENQRELLSGVLASLGMRANRLANAWVAFLAACVHLLSGNGRIAFVVPAEVMQVAYAEDLRLFLSERLARITLVAFERPVFPGVEQEVVVLIGEKGFGEKGIRVVGMGGLSSFDKLDLRRIGFRKMPRAEEKWTRLFLAEEEMELVRTIRADGRFARFADYGLINVGVTTGSNGYFLVPEDVCDEYGLENVTLPLVGRGSHVSGVFFTNEDWEKNKASGGSARLVCFPDIPMEDYPEPHKAYIALGEAGGVDKGYKCSVRDRWYVVPSVWVPDAFFLRRSGLYPRFVLNRCGAVSTDTMHRMRFNPGVRPENVLLSYYSSVSFAFAEICGRSYGGGVLEILPGEMRDIVLPRFDGVDAGTCWSLLRRIDTIVRGGGDIERVLDIVDKEVIVGALGVDAAWCGMCRAVWRRMRGRRLGRGRDGRRGGPSPGAAPRAGSGGCRAV